MKATRKREPWDNFGTHGFEYKEAVGGGQVRGDCPLCMQSDKFYLNPETTLWDCKRCGEAGNWASFLAKIDARNRGAVVKDKSLIADFLQEKGLDCASAIACGIGYNPATCELSIASYSAQGKITDVRHLAGKKWYASPGGKKGLINGDKVDREEDTQIVNIVEGESDLLALYEILLDTGRAVGETVVSLPGVGVYDAEWLALFPGKEIRIWFDADDAGASAADKWVNRASGVVGAIKVADWGDVADGFDVRDFIRGLKGSSVDDIYDALNSMLQRVNGESSSAASPSSNPAGAAPSDWIHSAEPLDPPGLIGRFRRWIHLPDEDVLRVLFGTLWANKIEQRDPVWLSLIGPPSDGKSTLIMALAGIPGTHPMTQATPASLIPGSGTPGVIQRANQGTLLLKDGTAIFAQDSRVRQEVMGIFRDAYDGRVTKTFGGGIGEVRVVSNFGFIMGTTRDFERHRDTAVGERLLLYRLPEIGDEEKRRRMDIVADALLGGKSGGQEKDLREAAAGFMLWERPGSPPGIDREWIEHIQTLAEFVAAARAMVIRDSVRTDNVFAKSEKEIPTRLFRQLLKLAIGCAWAWGRDTVGQDEIRTVAKVAWDTPPERDAAMLRAIFDGSSKGVLSREIAEATGYPEMTCADRLQDFAMTGLIERGPHRGRSGKSWVLESRFRETMKVSLGDVK